MGLRPRPSCLTLHHACLRTFNSKNKEEDITQCECYSSSGTFSTLNQKSKKKFHFKNIVSEKWKTIARKIEQHMDMENEQRNS